MPLIICLWACAVYAQTISPQEILDQVAKNYFGDFTLSLSASYKYYPEYSNSRVSDSMTSFLIVRGSDYYFQIGDYEFALAGDHYIISDRSSHQLIVSTKEQNALSAGNISLESILKQDGCVLSSFDAGEAYYGVAIHYSASQLAEADLTIDQQFRIKTCTIKYQEDIDWEKKQVHYSKLEIQYGKMIKTDAPFPSHQYGLERFVKINSGGVIKPSAEYNGFALKMEGEQ